MHVRRALLLFAIVLGLAALATSISRPARESAPRERSQGPARADEAPDAGESRPLRRGLRLPGPRGRRSVVVRAGDAVTLHVAVPEAGAVELPSLGLSSPAEPLTPARFELLIDDPGVHRVSFTPAETHVPRMLGRVVVRY